MCGVLVAHIVDYHTKKATCLAWGLEDDVLHRVPWRSVTRVATSFNPFKCPLLKPLAAEAMWLAGSVVQVTLMSILLLLSLPWSPEQRVRP